MPIHEREPEPLTVAPDPSSRLLEGAPPPPLTNSVTDVPVYAFKMPADLYTRVWAIESRRGERIMRRAWTRDVKRRARAERRAYRKSYPWSVRHRFGGKLLFLVMVVGTLAFFALAH